MAKLSLQKLNKGLLGDHSPPPSMVKDHTFALFNFGTLPLEKFFVWGPLESDIVCVTLL